MSITITIRRGYHPRPQRRRKPIALPSPALSLRFDVQALAGLAGFVQRWAAAGMGHH